MYSGNVEFLGSFVENLPEPETTMHDRGYLINEWQFTNDSCDSFVFLQKIKLSYNDMIEEWLTTFSNIFPEIIISDARRVLFDVDIKNKYPSNIVLSCIIVACEFHKTDFNQSFNKVKDIISKDRKTNKQVTLGKMLLRNLHNEANEIKKILGEKKFKVMERMWENVNGK